MPPPGRRAGQAGSTADKDFPGLAGLVGPDGSVAARLPDWREGVLTVDIPPARRRRSDTSGSPGSRAAWRP